MDLQGYLTKLRELDQVSTVTSNVSCDLELAALCRREFTKPYGGKALHFRQIEQSGYSAVANLFGSEFRTSQMLRGRTFAELTAKIKDFLHCKTGTSAQRLSLSGDQTISTVLSVGLLQSVSLNLNSLPAIRSWPGETGRYLTLALTVSQNPVTGERNLGLYRVQILASDQIALNFAPGSGAAEHLRIAAEQNRTLPVALVLGSDPALLWAAAAPLPENCDEFSFCSKLFDRCFRFTQCLSHELLVPEDAEIIIEGQIDPKITCFEGPFGNHTGSYVSRSDCPLLKITAIRQRSQPIVPLTVVGPPPSENVYLGKANQILIREMLKIDYPQIIDLQMPVETIFHSASLVKVRSQSLNDNRELIDNLWSMGPLRRAKVMILLDEDINLDSLSLCWWRTINNLASEKIYQNNGRIAIDATGVDPATLVVENQQTTDLLNRRKNQYRL